MKKVLVAVLAVALVATAADAATLRMNFASGDAGTATIAPNGTVDVEVWVDLVAGETLSTMFFANQPAVGLQQAGTAVVQGGWADGSVDGVLGAVGQQVAFAADPGNNILAPGSYLLGTQTIQGIAPGDWDIVIDHASVGMGQASGADMTFGPNLAGSVPNFWTYGLGGPFAEAPGLGSHDRTPLVLSVVPEPASLALLALGGLALIRRR